MRHDFIMLKNYFIYDKIFIIKKNNVGEYFCFYLLLTIGNYIEQAKLKYTFK